MIPITIKEPEADIEKFGRGRVWWQSWNEAYQGLVDEDYLYHRIFADYALRARDDTDGGVLIAQDEDGQVIGFTKVGPSCDDDMPDAGEVYQLYVLAEWYGKGVGYRLMQEGRRMLVDDGFDTIVLWVLEGNERAIAFYERQGFVADGHVKAMPKLGDGVTAKRMVWRRGGQDG